MASTELVDLPWPLQTDFNDYDESWLSPLADLTHLTSQQNDTIMTIHRPQHDFNVSSPLRQQEGTVSPDGIVFTPNSVNDAYQADRAAERSDHNNDFVLYPPVSAPHTARSAWSSRHSSSTPSVHFSWSTMEPYDESMQDWHIDDYPTSSHEQYPQQQVPLLPQQPHLPSQHFSPTFVENIQQPYTQSLYSPFQSQQFVPSPSPWQQQPSQQQSFGYAQLQQQMQRQQFEMMQPTPQPTSIIPQQVHRHSRADPSSSRSPQPPVLKQIRPRGSHAPALEQRSKKPNNGGRKKDTRLNQDAKQKASAMRKTGACWRCAFQRDSCPPGPPGQPCDRCKKATDKSPLYYIPCDRSKLPDFIHEFLPATMTFTYQKQIIQDCVVAEVAQWRPENSFEVTLTSGWGLDLKWQLSEFVPKSDDMLIQYQYFQDEDTRLMKSVPKYSPPFGIMNLESSNPYFDDYLNRLFKSNHLQDFSEMCYASESRFETFPEDLLNALCNLIETKSEELKLLVKKVIRMMILTYIMTHTLTIVPETLPFALHHVRNTPKPPRVERQKFTSPRLANRQLKFYFSVMREAVYKDLLRWGQRTLHASASKDDTWLLVFCAMLGFAMVLEEIQCNLQIQADAKVKKQEMSWNDAQNEARMACERIDERFDLLCRLFRYKYRSDSWSMGTFGEKTPQMTDAAEVQFLHKLKRLIVTKENYLRERRDVRLGHENQCKYTSRLVAKFLLPFLERR